MSHQVAWNKVVLEEFIKEAMLTETEEMILRTRVAGWSRVKQSMQFNMSVSNIDKITKRLKQKYDKVSKYDPILPPRRFSADETYSE